MNKHMNKQNAPQSSACASTARSKPIKNIVPFIIATIKNGWVIQEPIEPAKEKSHKELHGFEGREYDFDKLEAELFNRNL